MGKCFILSSSPHSQKGQRDLDMKTSLSIEMHWQVLMLDYPDLIQVTVTNRNVQIKEKTLRKNKVVTTIIVCWQVNYRIMNGKGFIINEHTLFFIFWICRNITFFEPFIFFDHSHCYPGFRIWIKHSFYHVSSTGR